MTTIYVLTLVLLALSQYQEVGHMGMKFQGQGLLLEINTRLPLRFDSISQKMVIMKLYDNIKGIQRNSTLVLQAWFVRFSFNLSAFAYRLFHEDFSSIITAKCSFLTFSKISYDFWSYVILD